MRDWGTDIEGLQANLVGQPETAWKYSFYTIVPDGMKWDQTTDTTKYPYIVDTGTTMLYLPPREYINYLPYSIHYTY